MTKVINLFGAPGAGKSTMAAGLFNKLKLKGINCELATEYAKDLVWREMNEKAFEDQLYITAKQHHRLHRLIGKVDVIVTDAPLFLSLAYIPKNYFPSFKPFLLELFTSFDNYNFLLTRTKQYNPIGRNQNEEESNQIGIKLEDLLIINGIRYKTVIGDEDAPGHIITSLGL